jgi:hypothetical protein
MIRNRTNALRFVAAGLFGFALYGVVTHLMAPAALRSDFVHGVWIGICVGLEVVGLAFLIKATTDGARDAG